VVAVVTAIPLIINPVPAQRCDSGTVLLSATASAGTVTGIAVQRVGWELRWQLEHIYNTINSNWYNLCVDAT
jgi:hypothetical protein